RSELRRELTLRPLNEDGPRRSTFIAETDSEAVLASVAVAMAAENVAGLVDAIVSVGRIKALSSQFFHPREQVSQQQLHGMIPVKGGRARNLRVVMAWSLGRASTSIQVQKIRGLCRNERRYQQVAVILQPLGNCLHCPPVIAPASAEMRP